MILEQYFSVPIWHSYMKFDTEKVKECCLRLRDTGFENVILSNRGGWQSRSLFFREIPEFAEMEDELIDNLNALCPQIYPEFGCRVDNMWININEKGNYNSRHYHQRSALSGVIYIDADATTGKIRFAKGGLQEHYPIDVNKSPLFYNTVEFMPKTGMLLVFPAWAEHEVEPSSREEPRISIAFNIQQIA